MPELLGAAAATRLRPILADSSPFVRHRAIGSLARILTSPSVAFLVDRIEVESDPRVRARLVSTLQEASGLRHRDDPRPWRDWLARLPDDWRPPRETSGGWEAEPRGRTTSVDGVPIVSSRIAFLIDLSGSIWQARKDGSTPKQVVDRELRRVLESLPPKTRFNLIPYTSDPHPWKDELVEAKPAHVRAAAAWFENRRDRGSGNFWDAALLALEDPDVDTIWVLTDGVPTGGPRYCLELMVPLLVERNASRGVAFDSLLFRRLAPCHRALARAGAPHRRTLAQHRSRTGGRARRWGLRLGFEPDRALRSACARDSARARIG